MIPSEFVLQRVALDWPDVRWGYERRLLAWSDVVAFAKAELTAGTAEERGFCQQIALIDKTSAHNLEFELQNVTYINNIPEKKWLYLCIAWAYHNKDLLKDPLQDIEKIYADFDYPHEMDSFVRFMPPTDGYDPSAHTPAENYERLMNNWRIYVDKGFKGGIDKPSKVQC